MIYHDLLVELCKLLSSIYSASKTDSPLNADALDCVIILALW